MLAQHCVTRFKVATAIAMISLMTACGGNQVASSTSAVTPLPEAISIQTKATVDLAESLTFSNSAATQAGLKFAWDFGDGQMSTEPAPLHRYAKVGDYEVSLVVSNQSGSTKEIKTKVLVNNVQNLRGLACSGAENTGWCWQLPTPSGDRVTYLDFVSKLIGWRVDTGGQIFKTSDGGVTWVKQFSGVKVRLQEIKFFDEKIGWAVGSNKTLVYTNDGGAHWKALVSPLSEASSWILIHRFGLITVLSPTSIILDSVSGQFITKDSGQTWEKMSLPNSARTAAGVVYGVREGRLLKVTPEHLYPEGILDLKDSTGLPLALVNIATAGEKVVIVRGRTADQTVGDRIQLGNPVAWRSDDAGLHWKTVVIKGLPVGSEGSDLFSLSTDGLVWLTQFNFRTYRSEDGGVTWEEQANHPYGAGDEMTGLTNVQMSGNRIYAKFNLMENLIEYSDNLGKTWLPFNYPSGFQKSFFSTDQFTAKNNLIIFKDTTNGAFVSDNMEQTWSRVLAKPEAGDWKIIAVAFRDSKNGILIDSGGVVKSSQDGGKTWKIESEGHPRQYGNNLKIQFVGDVVYVLKQDGLLYRSSDNGRTWIATLTGAHTSNFGAFDSNNAWARVRLIDMPILITRDGGRNWNPLRVVNDRYLDINAVHMDAGKVITVVGDAGFITQSTDDNQTWQRRYTGVQTNLRKVISRDGKTMWAIGDAAGVLRSLDGGVTWKQVIVPGAVNLNDIYFVDAKRGWIVGDNGYLIATTDGGDTWKAQDTGTTENLLSVQFVDAKTGWVVGHQGALLATGTGGF